MGPTRLKGLLLVLHGRLRWDVPIKLCGTTEGGKTHSHVWQFGTPGASCRECFFFFSPSWTCHRIDWKYTRPIWSVSGLLVKHSRWRLRQAAGAKHELNTFQPFWCRWNTHSFEGGVSKIGEQTSYKGYFRIGSYSKTQDSQSIA